MPAFHVPSTREAKRDRILNYHDTCLHFRCWTNQALIMLVLYFDVRVSDGKHIFQEVLITIYLFSKTMRHTKHHKQSLKARRKNGISFVPSKDH